MEEEDIGRYFDAARGFIEGAAAAGGAVLVHCHEGKSRSVTLVLAYLMQTQARGLSPARPHRRSCLHTACNATTPACTDLH